MNKKQIITIAGKLGSGKSSTAKKIAEILKYKHFSTGDFMRNIANKRNISLSELSLLAENDDSIDKALDDHNLEVGKSENIILDSRLGFHFIPESFKVFLELDPEIASQRILEDKKNNPNRNTETVENFDTKESIAKRVEERIFSERKRYKELYGIKDHTSYENFDLIINTKKIPLGKVVEKIIEKYNKWLKNKS